MARASAPAAVQTIAGLTFVSMNRLEPFIGSGPVCVQRVNFPSLHGERVT
jgi:hypothetical protein